ncbi:hypothetical protein BDW62DRAFT_207250 [Aspergillus aurantiobrunneus]
MYPDQYWSDPAPLSSTSYIRFMVPWMPRASRGNGPRHVLQPTLVVPRGAGPTNAGYNPTIACDIHIDSSVNLNNVVQYNTQMTASNIGPWGARHPSRKLSCWPAWQTVVGINTLSDTITGRRDHNHLEVIIIKNILFNTDPAKAPLRWKLIDEYYQAAAAAARRAIYDFVQAEAALFPDNGFSSPNPPTHPDKEWSTTADRAEIKTFVMPHINNILDKDNESDWIPSNKEAFFEDEDAKSEGKQEPSDKEDTGRRKRKQPVLALTDPNTVKKPKKSVAFIYNIL